MQKGFTLIEVLLYLALFAIVIGGSMVAVYQIIESTNYTNARVMAIEEGQFVQDKIDYSLFGADSVSVPNDTTLTVVRSGNNSTFRFSSGTMTIDHGAGQIPLNNSFVTLSQDGANPIFTYDGANKVTVKFVIDQQIFSQTKYVY